MNQEKKFNQLQRKANAIMNFMGRVKEKAMNDGALCYRFLDAHFDEEQGVFFVSVTTSDKAPAQTLEFPVEDYMEEYKFFIDREYKVVEIIRKPSWLSVEEFQKR